jgi:4-hydroxybenzoate polyprenyltransferase
VSRGAALLRALRPAHWLKNVPVGAALLFGHRWGDAGARSAVAGTFLAFCAAASAGYLVNDVVDRQADRAHPLRRARPVASGTLAAGAALAAAFVLGAGSLAAAAALLPAGVAAALGAYLALSLGYTFALKRVAVLSVVTLAVGFVVRVAAGAAAAGVAASPWLLALTALLALSLAVAKRAAGAARERAEGAPALRRIAQGLLALAALGYLGYTQAPDTVALHGTRALGWTAIPVAAALWRFAALLRRETAGRGPAEITASDPCLLLLGAAWVAACAWVLAS